MIFYLIRYDQDHQDLRNQRPSLERFVSETFDFLDAQCLLSPFFPRDTDESRQSLTSAGVWLGLVVVSLR